MSFSISYTYTLTDKYSAKLNKIIGLTEKFKRVTSDTTRALDRNTRAIQHTQSKQEKSIKKQMKLIDRMKTKVDKFGYHMINRASTISAIFGVGVSKVMLSGYLGFAEALNELAAISLTTSENMDKMEKKARKLGATTQFSTSQVLVGMRVLKQSGMDIPEILSTIEPTLKLALGGAITIPESSNILTTTARAFGIGFDDLTRIGNVLGLAQSKVKANITQLGASIATGGSLAKTAGLDFEEYISIIGTLSQRSMLGTKAATLFSAAMDEIVSPSRKQLDIYSNLDIDMRNFLTRRGTLKNFSQFIDKLQRLFKKGKLTPGHLEELFIKRGKKAMVLLIADKKDAIRKLTKIMRKESIGTLDKMKRLMERGLPNAVKQFYSALEALDIALFRKGGLDTFATGHIKQITESIRSMSDASAEVLKTWLIIGGFFIGTSIIVIGLGMISFAISNILGLLSLLAPALAFAFSPLFLVPVLLAAIAYKIDDVTGGAITRFLLKFKMVRDIIRWFTSIAGLGLNKEAQKTLDRYDKIDKYNKYTEKFGLNEKGDSQDLNRSTIPDPSLFQRFAIGVNGDIVVKVDGAGEVTKSKFHFSQFSNLGSNMGGSQQ